MEERLVIVSPDAEADIGAAVRWYEGQRLGLGKEFLEEVETAIIRIAANPFLHACLRRNPEVRRVLTRRFPYCIFFVRHADERIVVFRVLHGARDDRSWKADIPQP